MTRHSPEYIAYLQSPQWQAVRQRALRGAHGHCEHCGRTPRQVGWLEVNHKHYRVPFGQEQWPRDLEALCHACHRKADAARRRRNRRFYRHAHLTAVFSAIAEATNWLGGLLRRCVPPFVLAVMLFICVGGSIEIARLTFLR